MDLHFWIVSKSVKKLRRDSYGSNLYEYLVIVMDLHFCFVSKSVKKQNIN